MADLSQDEFKRIDKALERVLSESTEFTDFEVDFAFKNADRLGKYGCRTRFSEAQLRVVDKIEKKIVDMEEAQS